MLPPPGGRRGPEPPPPVLKPHLVARGKSRELASSTPIKVPVRLQSAAELATFDVLEQECGGRLELVDLLSSLPLSPEEDRLLGTITDPQNQHVALGELCRQHKISRSVFLERIKGALYARGQFRSVTKIAAKVPAVAEGVMDDAIPGNRTCRACTAGKIQVPAKAGSPPDAPPEMKDCTICGGRGTVYYEPSIELRKTALQLGKVLDKPSGAHTSVIVQQTNQQGMVQPGGYDKMISALDAALYGRGRERTTQVIESDPIE